jgi:predicted secreted protein
MKPIKIAQTTIVSIAALAWLLQLIRPGEGMGFVTGLVVFLIVWWIALFGVLPIGVTGQAESGDIVEGTDAGAPVTANLKSKAWITTVTAAIIWLVLFVILEFQLISLNDIPFIPDENAWGA